MRDRQTTTKGFAIMSAALVMNKFLALAYVPVQTWIVGNAGNAVINSGYKIYIFIYGLSVAGIPAAISKLISEQTALGNYKNCQKILKIAGLALLALGLVLMTVMAVGAKWISKGIQQPDSYLMIITLAPAIMFVAVSSTFRGYFQGRLNMIPTAVSQVIEQVINSILTIVFAALLIKYGIAIAAAGTTLGTSIGALVGAVYLVIIYYRNKNKIYQESLEFGKNTYLITSKGVLKQIFLYSFPAIMGIVVINAYDLIDLTLGINRIIAGGIGQYAASELYGIFTTQYQRLLNIPLALTAALPVALIPAISAAITLKDKDILYRKINEGFKAILIIIIPASTFMGILPQQIITFIFPKYNQGADIMMAGSWILILTAVISVQTGILIGAGKPYIPPINAGIGIIAKVILNYYLIAIPSINIKGAIIGTTTGYLIACILNYIMIKRILGVSLDFVRLYGKPAVAAAAAGIGAYLSCYVAEITIARLTRIELIINDVSLVIALAFGAAIYFFMLKALRAISISDIEKLPAGHKLSRILIKFHVFK